MKILFCTKNDIFGALILNWILPHMRVHELKIFLSNKTRVVETEVAELQLEKFLERDLPIEQIFPWLDAQGVQGECLTMQALARHYDVPIQIVEQINDPATETMLRAWQPDLIVSVRFSLIFKANILCIPRLGAFNLHPGALPHFAGLFSPMRALMAGSTRLGCTLHQMVPAIDAGPVYAIPTMPAAPEKSVFWHIEKLYLLGLSSLLMLLRELEQGQTPVLQTQNPAHFQYYSLPSQAEFTQLQKQGIALVCLTTYLAMLARFLPARTKASLLAKK